METTLQNILSSPLGSFAFVIGVFSACMISVWYISHFKTKFGSVERIENNLFSIKEDLGLIKIKFNYIETRIERLETQKNILTKRKSPISLTDIGEQYSKDLNAPSIIANHWQDILNKLNSTLIADATAYDIQVISFNIGDDFQNYFTKEELTKLKDHAFNAGYTIDIYGRLFGIIIRDKILQMRGIDVTEVDKDDPEVKNK